MAEATGFLTTNLMDTILMDRDQSLSMNPMTTNHGKVMTIKNLKVSLNGMKTCKTILTVMVAS